MYVYLVMVEKDDSDYEGSVVFTSTDRDKAVDTADHIAKRGNPVWVDRWPMDSVMTYQTVETIYARG